MLILDGDFYLYVLFLTVELHTPNFLLIYCPKFVQNNDLIGYCQWNGKCAKISKILFFLKRVNKPSVVLDPKAKCFCCHPLDIQFEPHFLECKSKSESKDNFNLHWKGIMEQRDFFDEPDACKTHTVHCPHTQPILLSLKCFLMSQLLFVTVCSILIKRVKAEQF